MHIVGIMLLAIGTLTLISGVAGGIAKMLMELRREARKEASSFGLSQVPTSFASSLARFVEALADAPVWLALSILGIILIALGGSMML